MSKLKLPIIILVVVVALGAGLMISGVLPGKSSEVKKSHVVEPIPLAEPFLVNLADTESSSYLAFNVALQLKPMKEEQWIAFSGEGGGGHGGATEAPGPIKVATYPKFYDAVMTVASGFTAQQLLTPEGKADLKSKLLAKFDEIYEQDSAENKSSASAHDAGHVGPPFQVMDVYFTKYVVKQ